MWGKVGSCWASMKQMLPRGTTVETIIYVILCGILAPFAMFKPPLQTV